MKPLWFGVLAVVAGAAVPFWPVSVLEAQGRGPAVISGRVMSDRGEPAVGTVVVVPELGLQVPTANDGTYTLTVPADRVLGQVVTVRARGIGYRPALRNLVLNPGRHEVNFELPTDIHLLDAVVVTGVTTQIEKAKLPFSSSEIDAAFLPVPQVNPISAIQGKVPGANIVSYSGRPGSQPAVILRGPKSINATGRSQEPLYIVDGVIVRGDLPDINPLDIERIEIVKGAAASSLYGAQAARGVIQIITKSGSRSSGGVQFHVRNETGFNDIERNFGIAKRHALMLDETGRRFCEAVSGQPPCARTFDYLETQAAINNTPGVALPPAPAFPVDPGAFIAGPVLRQRFQIEKWPHPTYDAVEVTVQPKPFTQTSVDMTGRVSNTAFYASAAFVDQPGAIRFLEGYERSSIRLNVDQTIGDKWQVGLRTYYAHATEDGLNQDGGRSFFRLTRSPPVVNPLARDTLGRLFIRTNLQNGGLQNENPLYWLENEERLDVSDRYLGAVDVQYTPLQWLELSGNLNFDIQRERGRQFRDKGFRDNQNQTTIQGGLVFEYSQGTDAVNGSLNLRTRHQIGDLALRPNLRYFYEQTDTEGRNLQGNFLAVQGVKAASNATNLQGISSSYTSTRQISAAAGLSAEFKERYIADGVIRRDGSSRFGAANRWDTYGRVSGAWRIAQEPWWPFGWVSEFKLRGSYGTAGNVPNFSAQYETFSIGSGGVVSFGTMGNKNLRPEKMYEVEVGTELELFRRILLSVTYAKSETRDQILPVPVPAATGFGQQWQNVGTLENRSWELSLDLPIVYTRDFSLSYKFIYDRTRTVVTELGIPPFNYGPSNMFRLEEGRPYGEFYGRYFLRSCAELPDGFRQRCGPNGEFQVNDDGFVVWVGPGNTWKDGITKNLWQTQLPASQAPYGFAINWGMPIIMRESYGGPASIVPLGNALPDFRFSVTQDLQWRRLTIHALLDGAIGHEIWNQSFHWAHLDFLSKDVDQHLKTVETAKPIGYYYRAAPPDASAGIGGLYDILGPNNFSVESASYAKLREVMIAYQVGPLWGVGDWSVSVMGRNLVTFTRYRGFDPEVGNPGGNTGSGAIGAIDDFRFPNLRSVTMALATRF
jgi:TonB-linked SusC/RagA family outer membrane protein